MEGLPDAAPRYATPNSRARTLEEAAWRRLELDERRLVAEIDELRDRGARDERALREAIEAEQSALARAAREEGAEVVRLTEDVSRCERELQRACAARVPVPDSEPRRSEEELQQEVDELLGRSSVHEAEPAAEAIQLVREKLSPKEMAWSLGVSEPTLRRHMQLALASPDGFAYPPGDRRNIIQQPIWEVLEVLSERLRSFVFPNFDLSLYHPTQVARMKRVLARPG